MAGSINGVGPTDAGLSRELPIWFIFNPESEYVPLEGKDDEVDGGSARSPGIDVRCDKVDSYGVPGCVLTQNRARLHPAARASPSAVLPRGVSAPYDPRLGDQSR